MPSARVFWRLFAIHWSDSIQYRADILLWTLGGALSPLLGLAVWYSVSGSNDVLTYYFVLLFVGQLASAWHGIFLANDILKGTIVRHLLRPVSALWHSLVNNLIEKSFKLPLILIISAVLYFFLPTVTAGLPHTPERYVIFSASLLLSLVLAYLLETVLGTFAFWLEDVHEIIRFKWLFEMVASGLLVPYAFMPPLAAELLSWLPFRYIFAMPVELLLGSQSSQQVAVSIGIQAAWVVVLGTMLAVTWQRGLRRYAVPGQ